MFITKSCQFNDLELLEYAQTLSSKSGDIREKLLHWDFGPLMTMAFDKNASNYLFSDEKVPLHWDGAFFKEPRKLLFYCTDSTGDGGETLFVNTTKLWNDLSEEEQSRCRKIKLTYRTNKLAHYGGEITVPLVQEHPETGETILRMAERVETRLNPVNLEIHGVSDAEEFYKGITRKLYQDKYLYEHQWEKGDLLICDNFTYLHGRKELRNNIKRTFKRIQIL